MHSNCDASSPYPWLAHLRQDLGNEAMILDRILDAGGRIVAPEAPPCPTVPPSEARSEAGGIATVPPGQYVVLRTTTAEARSLSSQAQSISPVSPSLLNSSTVPHRAPQKGHGQTAVKSSTPTHWIEASR